LWAAVVAAFVSVIYRRQSDVDAAKVRDLKLVYDLQLDREISARREYELSVESHLRRELASELRAQAADEVAGLRAELAALRANLEILFDADLSHRPAIETDRTTVRAYSDWERPDTETTGRVSSSRIDAVVRDDSTERTEESPIIDVPAEPSPPENEWAAAQAAGGAHRRPSEVERDSRRRRAEQQAAWGAPPAPAPPPEPVRETQMPEPPRGPRAPEPAPETRVPWLPPPEATAPAPAQEPSPEPAPTTEWQPAPAEGQFVPAGTPGSNWVSPPEPVEGNDSAAEYVGRRRAAERDSAGGQPAMSASPPEARRGRHSAPPEAGDPGRAPSPPTLATEPAQPPPEPEPERPTGRRHRSDDEPQTGGQSVAELLARLQTTPSGGGRRRRREE
jgi:hypothetical protein